MQLTTTVFLDERDVRSLIKQHLEKEGFRQIGEVEIITRSNKDIPKGATPGDCIGIKAEVVGIV